MNKQVYDEMNRHDAEEKYKAARLEDLKYEDERLAAFATWNGRTEPPAPVFRSASAEELRTYAAPDPFAAALKDLEAATAQKKNDALRKPNR